MVAVAHLDNGERHLIRARDLSVRYGEKLAVKSVTLDVGDREVLALIGPSG